MGIPGAPANRKPNLYRPKLGRGLPSGLRVKVFRYDRANPRTQPASKEEDWSGEQAAASTNFTPLSKPKPKPKVKAKDGGEHGPAKKKQKSG